MNITHARLALLMLVLLAPLGSEAYGQTSVEAIRAQLKSQAFAVQLKQDRNALVKGLIAIAADQKSERDVRPRAVEILGDLRASEASGTLITHIDEIISESIDAKTIESVFPCVPALIKIGKPGARLALQELRKSMEGARRSALVTVLGRVEGRKVGKLLLEDEIAAANRPGERKNLQSALKTFLAITANERERKVKRRPERRPNR